jgi:putative Mg2+ transporter-C (MgtC) family protein
MDPQLVEALPDTADVIVRMVVAALLGGLLGAEREYDGQDAGLRTHLLLSLGAALFGAISVGAFTDFAADPNNTILKHRGTVSGITTATSLWTTAAVGLAMGLGFWVGALTVTVLALIALRGLKPVSNWLSRGKHKGETV